MTMLTPAGSFGRTGSFLLAAAWGLACCPLAQAAENPTDLGNYPARYMGGEATLATAPSGAIINEQVLKSIVHLMHPPRSVVEVAEGLWVVRTESILNCIVIEAPEGLIVYDTGDSGREGREFREAIEAQISRRPIKAFIYSHSHYVLGTGSMVDDPQSVMILGHPKLNETVRSSLEGGGAPSVIPELGPVLTARAAVQFLNFIPATGPDAGLAPKIELGTPAFLPVNRPVQDGEILEVAGLKLQFFTEFVSDDYSVTVYIAEKKAVLNNFFWPGTPNLYTLRGAVFRDPMQWHGGLKLIRDLRPHYLLNTHAKSVVGEDQVAEVVTNYMDLIALTYDQSLRGILRGLGPDDLRYFVYKPSHLADAVYNFEGYGETTWFPPATFYFQMGWYDRDASKIFQLPPRQEAERLVALMGGREKVVEQAALALEKKEYAWAAQLVNYVYLLHPDDRRARQIKADALRKLGQLATGSIGRSFLLSEARALEGQETIPQVIPPAPAIIAGSPATFVNYHRVRIDPRRAEKVDQVITFSFGDETVGLHVRRGVAEFLPEPAKHFRQPDLSLSLDGPTWARLYLNASDLATEIKAGNVQITRGDAAAAGAVLDLFDRFDPARNATIPPLHD